MENGFYPGKIATVVATGTIGNMVAVGYDGAVAGANEAIYGISVRGGSAVATGTIAVYLDGVVPMLANAAALTIGAAVATDSVGKAIAQTGTNPIIGYVVTAKDADGVVNVKLTN